jgi:hypothetical protein
MLTGLLLIVSKRIAMKLLRYDDKGGERYSLTGQLRRIRGLPASVSAIAGDDPGRRRGSQSTRAFRVSAHRIAGLILVCSLCRLLPSEGR